MKYAVLSIFLVINVFLSTMPSFARDYSTNVDIYVEDGVENKRIAPRIQYVLDIVPDEMTDYIQDNNISFQVLAKDTFLSQGNTVQDDWVAFTKGKEDVFVNGGWKADLESAEAVIHEVGHIIDCGNGTKYYVYSETEEFDALYQTCNTEIGFYSLKEIPNKQELFAEGFMHYILNPGLLQKRLPDLYNYYKGIFPVEKEVETDYNVIIVAHYIHILVTMIVCTFLGYTILTQLVKKEKNYGCKKEK